MTPWWAGSDRAKKGERAFLSKLLATKGRHVEAALCLLPVPSAVLQGHMVTVLPEPPAVLLEVSGLRVQLSGEQVQELVRWAVGVGVNSQLVARFMHNMYEACLRPSAREGAMVVFSGSVGLTVMSVSGKVMQLSVTVRERAAVLDKAVAIGALAVGQAGGALGQGRAGQGKRTPGPLVLQRMSSFERDNKRLIAVAQPLNQGQAGHMRGNLRNGSGGQAGARCCSPVLSRGGSTVLDIVEVRHT